MKTNEKYRNNNETWWKIEKQEWTMMKKERETTMRNDEKERKQTMKNDEKSTQKQWNMMKNKEPTMKNDAKNHFSLFCIIVHWCFFIFHDF